MNDLELEQELEKMLKLRKKYLNKEITLKEYLTFFSVEFK